MVQLEPVEPPCEAVPPKPPRWLWADVALLASGVVAEEPGVAVGAEIAGPR
jgi:hypothetical protein